MVYKRRLNLPFCVACGDEMTSSDRIMHHSRYFPEEIARVHKKCHSEIHRDDEKYSELRPPDFHGRIFYFLKSISRMDLKDDLTDFLHSKGVIK